MYCPGDGQSSGMLMPGERVKVLLRFEDFTGMYVYHCHNLEHEDQGMMGQFLVLEPGATPRPMQMGTSAPTTAGHGGHGG